jgi:hypothetical protein
MVDFISNSFSTISVLGDIFKTRRADKTAENKKDLGLLRNAGLVGVQTFKFGLYEK